MNAHYHCVPTWNNLEDVGQVPTPPSMPPPPPQQPPPQSLSRTFTTQSHSTSLSAGHDTSMLDYEMAELTWENGQLTMHGLGIPRVPTKSNIADAVGWHKKIAPRANDTLESLFNQAYHNRSHKTPTELKGACEKNDDNRVPLFEPTAPTHHVPAVLDALVPSNNNMVGCSTQEASSSAAARVPLGSEWGMSMSMSASKSLRRKTHAKEKCEQILSMDTTNNKGLKSKSFGVSPIVNTKTFTIDDNDSTSQSRPKRGRDEEEENQKQDRAKSTKRSRAAAVHNQSERKRRDKINQRMKTLQKLVPNSNKVDKASILDEVIEYLKQLQAQVQMLSRMSLPSMMMPLAIQQQLQMPMNMNMNMMTPLNMGMNQMNLGMNSMIGRPNINAMNMAPYNNIPLATCDGSTSIGVGDCLLTQGTLPSMDPLSAYFSCRQSLPMAMDAYNRMATMYQQLQQQTLQQQRQNHQQHAPGNYNI